MEKKHDHKTGDLRIQLIKAASEIISREGLKKLTMRALSSRIGVSRTAAYRHFVNKDALLFAIAEEGFRELTTRYQKINSDTSSGPLLRIQNIGLAYIEFAVHNPGAFRLMFGQEITQHRRSEKLSSIAKETFNEYLTAVKAFRDEQNTTKEESISANYYWATVHGLATLLLDGQIEVSGENYGLPTLLTEKRPAIMENIHAMIDFSEKTIKNFWK
jgi:AcrR family transcriptional regulator